MELNISSPSKGKFPHVLAPKKNGQKGGWRKRRREEVIQRARLEKKLRPSVKVQQKSKALHQQADEFVSGIENGTTDANKTDFETGHARRNKGILTQEPRGMKTANDSPLSINRTGRLRNATEVGKDVAVVKRKPRPDASKPSLIEEKLDQEPEAVSAALAVISDIGVSRTAVGENKGANGVVTRNVSVDSSESGGQGDNGTFGASTFEKTGLYRSVALHVVNRMGLKVPTKIQEEVLKVMLNLESGQQALDILVRSATGSGKTLAYLLPIAHYLLNRSRRITRKDGTIAVIIVPTRELADQVEEAAENVFRPWHWIVVGSVRGGESKKREKARLRKGISILIATPGRLLDHMRNTRSFAYGFCEFLVLDEADRLLDLGFEGEIKEAIGNLDNQANMVNPGAGKTRSNILLSATLRRDVEKLAEFSLQNPIEISTSQRDEKTKASFSMPVQLRQHYCIVEQRHRLVTLACFLRLRALKGLSQGSTQDRDLSGPPCKIIVFFSTCDSVDFHYDLLKKASVPKELQKHPSVESLYEKLLPLSVFRIHGNHTQHNRVQSLRSFRRSSRAVLFCTDVAARGLDLKGLTFAIQYDPPTGGQGEELEYVHRAGRTARIGAQGDALLFLLPSERAYIGKLESKGVSISEISGSAAIAALYPKVDLSSQESISYGTRLVTAALQESFENQVKDNSILKTLAVSGFQAYCRAYATHAREVRYFFHVRNLHLGHVARSFVLGDKPAEISKLIAEMKEAKNREEAEKEVKIHETKRKGDVAKAIAEGERQPYNDQTTALARRRREKGRGQESFRELAMEFGS